MRIERVRLDGFGTFNRGVDIRLGADRLSVVMGRNEAGKSTIMSAMFGVLFGFKDAAVQKKFEPWEEHDAYAGEIELTAEDGRRFVVRRDFTDNTAEVAILNGENEEPLFLGSANPRGHTDDDIEYFRIVEQLVGFQDESIFRGTVFVGQSALETSITDQIRRLVSGSGTTDFKGILHDLHSRFSELTTENPWRGRTKSKPRKIERLEAAIEDDNQRLDSAREVFMKTVALDHEIQALEKKQAENKAARSDSEKTLGHFERFLKLVRDRDAARTRFRESNRRRETFVQYKDKVGSIDREIGASLERFAEAPDSFPEVCAQYQVERRQLVNDKKELATEAKRLLNLHPTPNNVLGGVLAAVGVAAGVAVYFTASPAFGIMAALILGIGFFFLGRMLATGFKEQKHELSEKVAASRKMVAERERHVARLVQGTGGILADEEPREALAGFRAHRRLVDERRERISAMTVLGDWNEIDATYEKTAEENLRCNGLMEIILRDAPYLNEIAEDPVAVARGMEELKRQVDDLQAEIEVTNDVITEAKIELARISGETDVDLAVLETEVSDKRRTLERLELDRDALRAVIETLESCVEEFQEGDLTQLSEEVSEIFRNITSNRYTRVTLSPNMEPMLTKFDNTHIAPDDLSQGTQDQLYFAMRVAVARHLAKKVTLPFFLDDPFVNFDRERLDVTRQLLDQIDTHQVVMVTCDRSYETWSSSLLDLDRARAEAHAATDGDRIELSPRHEPSGAESSDAETEEADRSESTEAPIATDEAAATPSVSESPSRAEVVAENTSSSNDDVDAKATSVDDMDTAPASSAGTPPATERISSSDRTSSATTPLDRRRLADESSSNGRTNFAETSTNGDEPTAS